MIDLDKKVLFIHVTKTGGCSVEYSFGIRQDFSNPFWSGDSRHLSPLAYKKHFDLSDFYKFTIVRNPFDRYASWCSNYFKKRMTTKLVKSGLPVKLTLSDTEGLTRKEAAKHETIVKHYTDPAFLREKFFDYLKNRDDRLRVAPDSDVNAYSGWNMLWWEGADYSGWFDKILKTETLNADYDEIVRRFNVSPLEVRNVSIYGHLNVDEKEKKALDLHGSAPPTELSWGWMYDDDTLEFLEVRVRADLEQFGYQVPSVG